MYIWLIYVCIFLWVHPGLEVAGCWIVFIIFQRDCRPASRHLKSRMFLIYIYYTYTYTYAGRHSDIWSRGCHIGIVRRSSGFKGGLDTREARSRQGYRVDPAEAWQDVRDSTPHALCFSRSLSVSLARSLALSLGPAEAWVMFLIFLFFNLIFFVCALARAVVVMHMSRRIQSWIHVVAAWKAEKDSFQGCPS